MLDEFFIRALLAGIGVALVAGPLGCFVVWRRLSYFGDTLAHAALLGVALGLLAEIHMILAVAAVSALVSLLLVSLQRRTALASDALLGLLSHSALALGLVVLSLMTWVRVDLMALLFGDILAVSRADLAIIYGSVVIVLFVLVRIWDRLFAATVNREMAAAEGLRPDRTEIFFMLLIAGVVAIAMKVVGVLLISALLIVPAATVRRLSSGPEQMAVLAAAVGCVAVVAGLFGSLTWDTPSGPTIVVAALVVFVLSLLPFYRQQAD